MGITNSTPRTLSGGTYLPPEILGNIGSYLDKTDRTRLRRTGPAAFMTPGIQGPQIEGYLAELPRRAVRFLLDEDTPENRLTFENVIHFLKRAPLEELEPYEIESDYQRSDEKLNFEIEYGVGQALFIEEDYLNREDLPNFLFVADNGRNSAYYVNMRKLEGNFDTLEYIMSTMDELCGMKESLIRGVRDNYSPYDAKAKKNFLLTTFFEVDLNPPAPISWMKRRYGQVPHWRSTL